MAFKTYWDYVIDKRKWIPFQREDEEEVKGRVVVITGATSGVGEATAHQMAKRGAIVVMACRDLEKAKKVMDDIKAETEDAELVLVHLDLGDLVSIRKCAEEIKCKFEAIHILINNAGVLDTTGSIKKTKDGFEIHMGINHLGHFLLTHLLFDLVKKGAPSRIVVLCSTLHRLAEIDFNDLMLEKRGSFGSRGYGPYNNSKLANLLFVSLLAKKLNGAGVTCYALCPGYVDTGVFRNEPFFQRMITRMNIIFFGISSEKGTETIRYCALSKHLAQETGKMYRCNKEWKEATEELNEEMALELWRISEELVGLKGQ